MEMNLFTEPYAAEQRRLHEGQAAYGSRGFYWAYLVAGIAQLEGCKSVLDYGCGKGTIRKSFNEAGLSIVEEYDPAIVGKEKLPSPADLVVCVDVMEHIEYDCLNAVLNHLKDVTRKILFVAIATAPSKRTMSDGRNTHLIVQNDDWWRAVFEDKGFKVRRVWKTALQEWVCMMNAPGNMRRI